MLGGYSVASTAPAALFASLSMARAQATVAAMLFSFAVFTVIVLWAYAAKKSRYVWLGCLLITGLSYLILFSMKQGS